MAEEGATFGKRLLIICYAAAIVSIAYKPLHPEMKRFVSSMREKSAPYLKWDAPKLKSQGKSSAVTPSAVPPEKAVVDKTTADDRQALQNIIDKL